MLRVIVLNRGFGLAFLGTSNVDFGLRLGLALQSGFQPSHRGADRLGIARSIRSVQRLGGLQHHLVACAQRELGLFAVGGLAIEGVVNRLTEGIPQFLFLAAVYRHAVCLRLPALL